jgi:hypothetical protein
MQQGLDYRFKIQDIGKYSQLLAYKDINWKMRLSALGKRIPDIQERKRMLYKSSHMYTLMKLLRQTDWG